jgi:hypothetical protein
MNITHVERGVLRRLMQAGGRYTFRPEGSGNAAHQAFHRDVVRILQSLQAKHFVTIDESASRPIRMPGREGEYASITAALTDAGSSSVALPPRGPEGDRRIEPGE